MNQIISALNGHPQFTVGFLDSQQKHFGAVQQGNAAVLAARPISRHSVVEQHRADQNIFAALTDFVSDVQDQARLRARPPRPARPRTRCAMS